MRAGASPLRRTLVTVALLAAGVLAFELAERVLRWVRAGEELPDREIAWIWDPAWPRDLPRPHAFLAWREFDLAAPPTAARLLIVADEEYLVHLNDRWVGAGRYRTGTVWDSYDVTRLLRRGGNRLLVELRSGRGAGGLLLCLRASEGECLVRSDGDWRVLREPPAGLPRRAAAPRALVWGIPPAGGWPVPGGERERPPHYLCVRRPREVGKATVEAGEPRGLDGEPGQLPVWQLRWRRPVNGFLRLGFPEPGREVAVISLTSGRSSDETHASLDVVTVDGTRAWTAVEPRQIAAADALGLPALSWARVLPLRPGCEELTAPPTEPRLGLLGLAPPGSRSPVENELRRQLEGVARR